MSETSLSRTFKTRWVVAENAWRYNIKITIFQFNIYVKEKFNSLNNNSKLKQHGRPIHEANKLWLTGCENEIYAHGDRR